MVQQCKSDSRPWVARTGATGQSCDVRENTPARRRDLAVVVRRAGDGDERAWRQLVAEMDGVLRSVAKRYRLASADVEDVVQTTWLRAVEHAARLNDPAAIAGWIIVTARR
jgi:DNA-directed RNA polymerase specialized sigma24 family protein